MPQKVDNLPVGIDGLPGFIIKKSSNEEQTSPQLLQDGRRVVQQNGLIIGTFGLQTAKGHINVRMIHCLTKYSMVSEIQCNLRKERSWTDLQSSNRVCHCGKHTCPMIKPANKNKLDVAKLIKK
jgi:hypothetical protein